MTVSVESRSGELAETINASSDDSSSQLRVAMPGIIQSFDAVAVTCVVQPAIKGSISDSDGNITSVDLPLLMDVPVQFPRGGGVTLTFPISAGDECMVIYADRCIDFWWQNGGVQEPVDDRQHHSSDAFAIVGPQSQARKISGISTTGAQLRTDDGAAFIELSPSTHNVKVITTGKLEANADGGTEITSPTIVLNGAVTINGPLTQGQGSAGGDAKMQGPVQVVNDVTAGSISLQGHRHSGVQTGSGNTGGPL